MIGDPAAAPPRTDLPYLRRRARPRAPAPSAVAPAASTPGIDYTHPRRAARAEPAAPPPPSDALDLSDVPRPSAPATPHPARPQPPGTRPSSRRPRRAVRVTGRVQHLLTRSAPTVTLTRVQSGVGHLSVEAVIGAEVGDLRMAAAYQLRSAGSSVLGLSLGRRFAPPSGRRPVLVAGRDDGYERISLDLRQIRDVARIGILAFSESRRTLTWGGTLVLSTYGGARIELPLESLYPGTAAMLMSLYNVDGELVVRAEMETIAGDVRETARAYGYDRITWRDDRNPVD